MVAKACEMPSERSVDSLSLAEAQALVLQDAELRQCLVDIARRQAGGASKGGRYNKHDTARLVPTARYHWRRTQCGELMAPAM